MSTDGRVAIVTGGASGIGAAFAHRLSGRGYRVVVADIDADGAARVAAEVGGSPFELDAADLEQNRALADAAVARYGRLDVVCLNVGVNSGQQPGDPLDPAKYHRAMRINVDSAVFGIEAVTPVLMDDGGAIVVTASAAALAPRHANPVYTATKSAVVGYVRAMARPLAFHGVTVNTLCPAFVDTPMLSPTLPLLRQWDFPVLTTADVADALESVLDGGETGQAWALVAGQPPTRYEYPELPPTLRPDGTPAHIDIPPPTPRVRL